MKDLDELTSRSPLSNWTFTRFVKQTNREDLVPLVEEALHLEEEIHRLNRRVAKAMNNHFASLQIVIPTPPKTWEDDALTLGEALDFLETLPQDTLLKSGLGYPHSFRGKYECLAVEPGHDPMTVKALRELLLEADGEEYYGYNGGEYVMHRDTHVYVSEYGTSDDSVPLSLAFLKNLLP